VWLTLPFYDFCGFRSVAVNIVYKLQFFTFIIIIIDQIFEIPRYHMLPKVKNNKKKKKIKNDA